MSTTTISSVLRIALEEDATKNGPRVADALAKVQKQSVALRAALAESGLTDRMQASLAKLGASAAHVRDLSASWKDFATAEGLAGVANGKLTKEMIDNAKAWEKQSLAVTRVVMGMETAQAKNKIKLAVEAEEQERKANDRRLQEAVRSAERARADKERIAQQEARDAARIARERAAEERQIARQTTRDAERDARERLRVVERERREEQKLALQLAREKARTDNTVAGVASFYAAHEAEHAAVAVMIATASSTRSAATPRS